MCNKDDPRPCFGRHVGGDLMIPDVECIYCPRYHDKESQFIWKSVGWAIFLIGVIAIAKLLG